MAPKVFYVGSQDEVEHHARPLVQFFNVEIVEPEKVVQQASKHDLAIFFSEHFRRFRTAVTQLREKGCRTLYAIDGILEWRNSFENRATEPACPWTMRPVLSDKVAAIGRSQARLLEFWGNKNRVELVGLPRLDNLLVRSQRFEQSPQSARPQVLVMTAKWPAFTESQQINLVDSLVSVRDWFEGHPEFDVKWRLTADLDQKLGLDNSLKRCQQEELIDLLNRCDALVTTPSTAMLEGMLLNKPTAILEFNDCPQFNNVAWQIRHPDQLDHVIPELISPSKFKIAQQEYALHDTLECHSPALPRLIQLIEGMLASPAGDAPETLVEIDSPERRSQLDPAFLFNGYRLAEFDDVDKLKAQLAFLEREYKLLQERNELVEGEFLKAEKTIQQLFNNPVVYPFIKAGEVAGKIFAKPPKTEANQQKS